MIEVGRNSIVIRDIDKTTEAYKTFQYRYSLWDGVTHKYTFHSYVEEDKDIYLPTTIGLNKISSIFKDEIIETNYKNIAKAKAISYNMKHPPRNELQMNAIKFLLTMKKDEEGFQRFISLETGSGKTYVTINFISQMKKKAMIIVDGVSLAEQWKNQFLEHTDLNDEDILILSGKESIDSALKNQNAKIYIAIHRTLNIMMNSDIGNIHKIMNKLGIGIRVFDEAHVEFGNICKINSVSNVMYTLYLTATPDRSNFNDSSLYAKIFRNVPYFNGKDMNNEKYHTVIMYNINTCPGTRDQLSVKTKYGFSQSLWASYITQNRYDNFINSLEELIRKFKLHERKKKTAIILPTIELIKMVKEDIERLFPNDFTIGTFIGEIPKKDRMKELENSLILTNDKIFDKGIDVRDLEIIINMSPISSAVKTEQILGRLRNRPDYLSILIDVTDCGFQECIRQQKNRKRFYKKKAKKIIEEK